jgi:hypothetical protein
MTSGWSKLPELAVLDRIRRTIVNVYGALPEKMEKGILLKTKALQNPLIIAWAIQYV